MEKRTLQHYFKHLSKHSLVPSQEMFSLVHLFKFSAISLYTQRIYTSVKFSHCT